MRDKYVAICDGFCTSNGSYWAKAGGSYAVFKVSNEMLHPPLESLKDPILENNRFEFTKLDNEVVNTNNAAEALTMYTLLLTLINEDILTPENFVIIYSDSALIINQIKGIYKVNNTQLRNIYKKVNELFKDYKEKWGKTVWDSMQIKHVAGTIIKQTIIGH